METEKMMCGVQHTDTFTRESVPNFRFGNCKNTDTMSYFYVSVANKKKRLKGERYKWEP